MQNLPVILLNTENPVLSAF